MNDTAAIQKAIDEAGARMLRGLQDLQPVAAVPRAPQKPAGAPPEPCARELAADLLAALPPCPPDCRCHGRRPPSAAEVVVKRDLREFVARPTLASVPSPPTSPAGMRDGGTDRTRGGASGSDLPSSPTAPPEPSSAQRSPADAEGIEAGAVGGSGGLAAPLPSYIVVTKASGTRRWYLIVEVRSGDIIPPGPLVVAESHHRTNADRVCAALIAWARP